MKKLENGNFELTYSELKDLLKASFKLDALEGGGVDNWEGYDESLSYYLEEDESFSSLAEKEIDNL